jgi:hypothetical protein
MPKGATAATPSSERQSRRVADINNAVLKKTPDCGLRRMHRRSEARIILGGATRGQNKWGMQGPAPHGLIWPKRRDIAVSHRSWAADIKIDRATERIQGTATRGRSSPHGTRRGNGHAKRHWGRDCQCTWKHLIRKPAKLTGARHELFKRGEPTRPGVGSPSRKRYTQLTGSGLDLEPETEVTKLRMARRS